MRKEPSVIIRCFSKINNTNLFKNHPFVILIGIVAYEVMKINFQLVFKEFHSHETNFFDNLWVFLGVVGSTALGLFSDRFIKFSWRKPIVLFGMLSSLISGVAFLNPTLRDPSHTSSIWFFVLLSGLGGSYLGASRAFYLDHYPKRKILFFTITVICQCIPWAVFGALLSEKTISLELLGQLSAAIMFISLLTNLFYVNDDRKAELESRHTGAELKEIYHKYNRVRDWSIISAFLMLAISYHLMPYYGEYAFSDTDFFREILVLGVGVSIGALFALLFVKVSTLRALKIGYAISCLYFVLYVALSKMGLINGTKPLWGQFFIFAAMGGTLWILSIKEFLLKSKDSEDGFILGFIESIQSLGELVGAGLSSWISSESIIKNQLNVKLFIFLLIIAFGLVSLESMIGFFKKIRKERIP